jgi:hypothetical protein
MKMICIGFRSQHIQLGVPTSVADPRCLSRIRLFSIPDPGSESKNLSILTPKKWFLSSRKYYRCCSSRIPNPDADFLPMPEPESRGQKGTGSRIRIRNTGSDYRIRYPTRYRTYRKLSLLPSSAIFRCLLQGTQADSTK